jgi:hypothetical protein
LGAIVLTGFVAIAFCCGYIAVVSGGFVDDFVEQATNVRNSEAMRKLLPATPDSIFR